MRNKTEGNFFSIFKKEPVAWFTLLTTLVIGVLNCDRIMSHFDGKVSATIGSTIDGYGRLIDTEILIENMTEKAASNIIITFDVDHFTSTGCFVLRYGDEKEKLITTVSKTIIDRKKYIPIDYSFDPEHNRLIIPRLLPKQYLHIYLISETRTKKCGDRFEARKELLRKKDQSLMDKPKISGIHYSEGFVKMIRVHNKSIGADALIYSGF